MLINPPALTRKEQMSKSNRTGAWKKGQSGNPAGRKPGTGKVQVLRDQISEHVPEIIQGLLDSAKSGDVGAARLLLERVVPALRSEEKAVFIDLPQESLTAKGEALLTAASRGEITLDQGARLISALGQLAKVSELDELTQRIEKLENKHGQA